MDVLQAIILGIIQGLTEFIPISSSGHLVIAHRIMGIEETGLTFDVALHIGTLMALVIFFYKDIAKLVVGLFRKTENTKIAWMLVLATLPAVLVGVLLQDFAETSFRSVKLVAFNLMIFGVVMLYADKYSQSRKKRLKIVGKQQAMAMGIAQAAAIIPGISRSGSTITAGLFAGLDRVAATRFSFLLAIPVTAGAIIKVLVNESTLADINGQIGIFLSGVIAALISGSFAIKFLLGYLAKHSLLAFAYYRITIGFITICILLIN